MKGPVHIERWAEAHEIKREHVGDKVAVSTEILAEVLCATCKHRFEIGEYARWRYGPHGGVAFHDDCSKFHTGDEEQVACIFGKACPIAEEAD